MELTCVQVNANRSVAAMDMAWATALREGAHLILVSEPNKAAIRGPRWYTDTMGDAAIGYTGARTIVNASGSGNGYVWVRVNALVVYSCYISPNINLDVFRTYVNDLHADIVGNPSEELVLTGDFNSKSALWGSRVTDTRGNIFGDLLSTLDLVALNEAGVYTFVRGSSGSTIDVTAVSKNLATEAARWKVLEDEASLSPHLQIIFTVGHAVDETPQVKWIRGPVDGPRLAEELRGRTRYIPPHSTSADDLTEILRGAYTQTTRKVRTRDGRVPYWWTAEIAALRADTLTRRRAYNRTRARRGATEEETNAAHDELKAARKSLRTAIVKAKQSAWDRLIQEAGEDVYGQGYKIVSKGMKVLHPPTTLTRQGREEEINRLFPEAVPMLWDKAQVDNVPLFTLEELRAAASKLKNGKAPGRDGIPAEAVKVAVDAIPEIVLGALNAQLQAGTFPRAWKEAKVVLIEKGKKDGQHPATFRPLCLIDSPAKLYEHLILGRLVEELEGLGGLSTHQHGFRRGHSTVMAVEEVLRYARRAHRALSSWCLLILVDVRNAFNTAAWHKIIEQLERKGVSAYLINVIKDYLTDRAIFKDKQGRRSVNVGVPQGSVLGPTLWNVMYDGVLGIDVPEGASLVGYADDLAIVVTHKELPGLQQNANETIERVAGWLSENELQMAPEKTEPILLKFGRRNHVVPIIAGGMVVETREAVKYLGVTLDSSVSFGPHIRQAAAKAERTVAALSKLMPNIGGMGERKRRALCAVAHSVLLYGAPIWAKALQVDAYKRVMQSVQRKMALRICMAYITVSFDAATALASVIPIHLLADERRRSYEAGPMQEGARKTLRERTLDSWQEEWLQGSKGAWTRRLIRDVRPWTKRMHGELDFHLTQGMTGHGAFRAYTHRIGKAADDTCHACGTHDTAEHALFHCATSAPARAELNERLGTVITPENMVAEMLTSMTRWQAVKAYVGGVMRQREQLERTAGD